MRVLGIGEYCDLGALYHRLVNAGHEVKVFVENVDYHDVYQGILHFTKDWQQELDWIREAGAEGIIVFESAIKGEIQDDLRQRGFQVIGGSAFGDRLEGDRNFGQQIMAEMGMNIAQSYNFKNYEIAKAFIKEHGKRYVYKNNGADTLRTQNYVGVMEDGSDLEALLTLYQQHHSHESTTQTDFVLMEHITGIEIGIGAFFNGEHFLQPACLDWEHKRFFPGDLGELTGEMGTIVSYQGSEIIFNQTLIHLEEKLRTSGYCGYINLNMIANAQGLWPLEFTSRFGYPGYSICAVLHEESWESIFKKMLTKSSLMLNAMAGFAAGIVLTVPPFPYSYGYADLSKGTPVLFHPSITTQDHDFLDFSEVEIIADHLYTSGMTGCIGTAMGFGETIGLARDNAYSLAAKVILPNIRYRKDIGEKLALSDFKQLVDWGYIR